MYRKMFTGMIDLSDAVGNLFCPDGSGRRIG